MKVLLVYLIITLTGAVGQYHGTRVGRFSTLAHRVSGTAYIMNDRRIFIENFNYDGAGPAAYFYVGTSGTGPTRNNFGVKFPDENGNTASRLRRYNNDDLTLTVPRNMRLSNIRWISVWCDEFYVDFGHVTFLSGLTIPATRNIGQFSRLAHQVRSGDVTVINHKQLEIKQFWYDGNGPDAFFLVGKGYPKGSDTKVPDHKGRLLQNERYNGVDMTLTLPDGVTMFDIDYVSLYCIRFTQNFGQVNIPQGLAVPPFSEIPTMMTTTTEAPTPIPPEVEYPDLENCEKMSDSFYVAWTINNTHIVLEFTSTNDDGRYMAFGLSAASSRSAMYRADVIVAYYNNQPAATDYYLSGYSPCSRGVGACPDTETGGRQNVQVITGSRTNGVVKVRVVRRLQTGDSKDHTYSRSQSQYIVWAQGYLDTNNRVTKHNTRLRGNKMIDFGRSTSQDNCGNIQSSEEEEEEPDTTTTTKMTTTTTMAPAVPQPRDGSSDLENCEGLSDDFNVAWTINTTHITLELRSKMASRRYMAFGLSAYNTGSYMYGADVIVAYYDGQPMATDYYLLGKSQCSNGRGACPDTETGGRQNVQVIAGSRTNGVVKVRVVRPLYTGDYTDRTYSISRSQYIVWAQGDLNSNNRITKHDQRLRSNKMIRFGRSPSQDNCIDLESEEEEEETSTTSTTKMTTTTTMAPAVAEPQDDSSDLENCEEMSDDFNVGWKINSTHIILDLISTIGARRYMAFGLSGSTSRSAMIGADVVVAHYDSQPVATDYYLEAYAQCSNGRGACPDVEAGGRQDVQVITGSRTDGVVKVRVVRRLQTADSIDKSYSRNQAQYIVWALGGLNPENLVTKHDRRLRGNKMINFGRSAQNNCNNLKKESEEETDSTWKEQVLYGDSNRRTFTVRLGPTGGDKGYKAITGEQSWGIAYYINGYLIPRLVLKRGITYTFIIESGYDFSNTAEYHPFYITNDPRGGYSKLTLAERLSYQYYSPLGVGRYCEYRLRDPTSDALETSDTFEEYKRHLVVDCKPGYAGQITFTPTGSTPDLLYYQCYTHYRLGWKINIID